MGDDTNPLGFVGVGGRGDGDGRRELQIA